MGHFVCVIILNKDIFTGFIHDEFKVKQAKTEDVFLVLV